jgi:hypothetical protein
LIHIDLLNYKFPRFRSHEDISEKTITRLTQALTPDVLLYDHFSAKLKKRLETMPPEFQKQLKEFREAKSKVWFVFTNMMTY